MHNARWRNVSDGSDPPHYVAVYRGHRLEVVGSREIAVQHAVLIDGKEIAREGTVQLAIFRAEEEVLRMAVKKKRRTGYRDGVGWIAMNDESGETDVTVVADLITVLLLADLFGKAPSDVAHDVVQYRRNAAIREG